MIPQTYRNLAWVRLLDVVHEATGGTPESDAVAAALQEFRVRFNGAIDAVPAIAAIFDRSESDESSADEVVDPINRADDIAAQIAGKLQEK